MELVLDASKYKTLSFKYKLARFSLLLRKAYPFLGEVCMRVEKYGAETRGLAATDGLRFYFNENEMNKLPEEAFNFVLLHELFHIILRHRYPKEAQFYEKMYWNIAFDLIADWLIISMENELKYHNLPIMPVSEAYMCSDDLSDDPSHRIASAFVQQSVQQGVMSDSPPVFVEIEWKTFKALIPNIADYVFDVLDIDASNGAPSEADIKELLASCAKAAGNKGMPRFLKGLMEDLTSGRKLPWLLILRRFLETSRDANDFDFCPPDTRLLYSELILPASNEEDKALNNAMIVLDVSSSVSKEELLDQIWQIMAVLSELEFSGSILSFGSNVYQEALLTDKESLKRFIDELKVGGGTDWAEVVQHIQQKIPNVKSIIVFTDGQFYSYDTGLRNVIFVVQGESPDILRTLGKVIEVKKHL